MKLLIITSGLLPMPNVKGGAVEDLLQHFIQQNEINQDFELTVVSTYDQKAEKQASCYKHTRFVYTNRPRRHQLVYRLVKKAYRKAFWLTTKKRLNLCIHPEIVSMAKVLLEREPFDQVIVLNLPEFILPLRQVYHGRMILYLHNDNLNVKSFQAKKIAAACQQIFTVSHYIKRRVLSINTCLAERIKVITNGRDISQYMPLKRTERELIRSRWHITPEDRVIVFSGRLHPLKGIDQLIAAVKQLAGLPNIKLLVVGAAFYSATRKNSFIRRLEREAAFLEDKIIFTGYVASTAIPALLMSADIAVVPTISEEPSGLSVLEAQAAGLPLIATRVGGIPEITSAASSYLVEANHDLVTSLAETLTKLIHNQEQRRRMGLAGREHVKQYSVDHYYQALKKAIVEG